jgi:hypothetical protein
MHINIDANDLPGMNDFEFSLENPMLGLKGKI